MKGSVLVLAIVVAAGLGVLSAGAHPAGTKPTAWPQFHYSAAHLGVNPHEKKLGRRNVSRLAVAWSRKVPKGDGSGILNSSAAVGKDTVYVGNGDGKLYAFRRADGKARWTAKTGHSIQSSPAVAGGKVYVGSNDGYLYAFRASDGKRIWKRKVGLLVGSSSPTVAGGTVYIGSTASVAQDGKLVAVNAKTGSVRWQAALTGEAAASSATIAGRMVYVGEASGDVLAFTRSCSNPCTPVWSYELQPGLEVGTPVLAAGKLFASGDGGGGSFLYAFDASCHNLGCAPLWHADTLSPYTFSTPAVQNGRVFVQGGRVFAFPVSCGRNDAECKPIWRGLVFASTSPAVANGIVYVGSARDGRLYAFGTHCATHGKACKALYRSAKLANGSFAGSPAVVDGRVYFGAFTRMRAFAPKR